MKKKERSQTRDAQSEILSSISKSLTPRPFLNNQLLAYPYQSPSHLVNILACLH